MESLDAIFEIAYGVRIKNYRESITTTGSNQEVDLGISVEDDDLYLIIGVDIEKADDNDDATFFYWDIVCDTETFGDISVPSYHSIPASHLPFKHFVAARSFKVRINIPAAGGATRVGVSIIHKKFNKNQTEEQLAILGKGHLVPS